MADPDAEGDADADEAPEAEADPLGAGVVLGVGLGVGDGKIELGMFANERAKISTKMMTTIITQIFARLSVRGGSEPRYPADGPSEPRSDAERR